MTIKIDPFLIYNIYLPFINPGNVQSNKDAYFTSLLEEKQGMLFYRRKVKKEILLVSWSLYAAIAKVEAGVPKLLSL